MYVILDWVTHMLVVEKGTDRIQLFDTDEKATHFAEREMQRGLWSLLPVPEDAMFYMD